MKIENAKLGFEIMCVIQAINLKAISTWVTPEAQGRVGIPQVEKIEERV